MEKLMLFLLRNSLSRSYRHSQHLETCRLQLDLASEEIDHLLKRGAYDVFREDDEEGKDFVEANIDDIMKRAATKVRARPGVGCGQD